MVPLAAVLFGLAAVSPVTGQTWNRAGTSASVSGWVRDATGVPQIGALVQVLAPNARLVGTAVTDMKGRYRLVNLPAGSYLVRATQALYLPAQRDNLKLVSGSRAVVDLTLATLFTPSQWLPAQRREPEESGDDWMWTLRSSASRPILRWVDDGTGAVSSVEYSSSATELSHKTMSENRLALISDDSGFAHGGVHQSLTMERVHPDGVGSILRADLSGARTPYPVAPSADVVVGFERGTVWSGYQRTLLTYHLHPELVGRGSSNGMQAATIRSAQRVELGDTVMIDAGSMLREVNMAGNAVSMLPFVRVSVKPAEHVILTYGYATSGELQSLDDLDRVEVEMPVAVAMNGHLRTQRGEHQTLGLSGRAGRSVMEIAIYRDKIDAAPIAGTGVLTSTEIAAGGVVADPTTQSFRALSGEYESSGYRVLLKEELTKAISLTGQYETGSALIADGSTDASVQGVLGSLRAMKTYAATVSLNGRLLRTGTRFRAAYRWQPESTLTAVDAYHSYGDAAYFGLHLRQPLHINGMLPHGFEAVVDVTNLLAQGYRPFVSSDGRTLYFAQAPKVLQAGLSFTF
ncbi:carboxypeptidase-like regulatory domain-containing protein [Terriglobus saanensis]|uniref:carboxypeptidase-like regulatory domain-containing protein n=1 Tax=Terriglobus saanensis TaxID=870903 RepID=UPI001651788C|nr:carboxypeptidase-like regulatory domain-containing protein [Terriglobus saanensis]